MSYAPRSHAPESLESLIGKRVTAWVGPREGDEGTVVRVDGIAYAFIRWDSDGETTHYSKADTFRLESA